METLNVAGVFALTGMSSRENKPRLREQPAPGEAVILSGFTPNAMELIRETESAKA